jgi:N-acetylglucosamine-6-phosphate deacetylase
MEYVDLQVNGAFGVDFNDDALTLESFESTCRHLRDCHVGAFLPTIITDSIDRMCQRIAKIAEFVDRSTIVQEMVHGIHVEGPFLSTLPGYYGTHPLLHVQSANASDAMRLLDSGKGLVQLFTMAPEQDPKGSTIARLKEEKIIVFAGHTNASFDSLSRAIDCGLDGFTHLGNGCAHQVDRHDNIMQRVLALRQHLYVTLIADGVHLPGWLLQSWLEIIGMDRCIVISDSMSAAGMPPGEYSIGGQPIQVNAARRTTHREHGYLAGSASTMADMDRWMSQNISITASERDKVLNTNAKALLSRFQSR